MLVKILFYILGEFLTDTIRQKIDISKTYNYWKGKARILRVLVYNMNFDLKKCKEWAKIMIDTSDKIQQGYIGIKIFFLIKMYNGERAHWKWQQKINK